MIRTVRYMMLLMVAFNANSQTLNSWARVADFGGIVRESAIAFSIDSFGYVGLGRLADTLPTGGYIYPTDIWQYNPYTNIWTRKANFPGIGRGSAICFTIGSKAYVGLGDEDGAGINDFWEYDPALDSWTQKGNYPGVGMSGVLAFSIGGNGYVGMGYSDLSSIYGRDIWKYSPASDSWLQLNNFPGTAIQESHLFNINGVPYVGLGYDNNSFNQLNDLWKYNPISDTWIQIANTLFDTIQGKAISGSAFAFSLGNQGYLNVLYDSAGNLSSSIAYISRYLYKYNPVSNNWILKDSFPDRMNFGMSAFCIGNIGYAGTGYISNLGNCQKDFWMYTPDSISTGINSIDANSIIISPNPAKDKLYINGLPQYATLTIIDMAGRSWPAIVSDKSIDLSTLSAGIYCLQIQNSDGIITKKFVKE